MPRRSLRDQLAEEKQLRHMAEERERAAIERAEKAEASQGPQLRADPADRWSDDQRPSRFTRIIRFKIGGHTVPVYLHTLVAVGILAGLWAAVHIFDIQFFGQADDEGHIDHLWNMIIFASTALAITVVTIYIVTKTAVQDIVLPFYDELVMLVEKWKRGEGITHAEALLAIAMSIHGGLRIAGVFLLQALLATPL